MKRAWILALVIMAACLWLTAAGAEVADVSLTSQTTYVSEDGADNDTLFAGYVAQAFGLIDARDVKNFGGDLTGNEAVVYAALKPWIDRIAAGDEESTRYTLPFDMFDQTTWTAEELGVDAIIVDGAFSDEAKRAASGKYAFDLSAVMDALRLDSPYELYWYDKTSGADRHTSMQFSASHDGTQWYMTVSGGYELTMAVASEYAGADSFTVDTAKTGAAATAAENAGEVLAQYASMPDYAKLVGYKEAICELVSYNHEAADDDTTPYGNPWQLIWVFDGDDTTNVVCEGYSKAFQYLCDQTEFSDHVTCYSVSGTMRGGTGEGPHMWNVVHMPDGNNYLVDVTNCDSGSVGADDLLFMKGYASGSAGEGYVYDCDGQDILYVYDDDTLGLYAAEDLILSAAAYDPGQLEYWGSCLWEVSNGTLRVYAGTGADTQGACPWDWSELAVHTIVFEEGVILPADCSGLFRGSECTALELSGCDASGVTDMTEMFSGCASLTSLDLSGFVTDGVSAAGGMFAECPSLQELKLGSGFAVGGDGLGLHHRGFWVSQAAGERFSPEGIFKWRGGVADTYTFEPFEEAAFDFEVPEDTTTIGERAFAGIDAEYVRIPNASQIGARAFANCPNLKAVWIANGNEADIDATAFEGCPEDLILIDASEFAHEYGFDYIDSAGDPSISN